MKTIICDIDGTITDMWPIEKTVLLFMTNKNSSKEIEAIKLRGIFDTYKIFLKVTGRKISKKEYFVLYNQVFIILRKTGMLPAPEKYALVDWILKNKNKYHFVYATGGQRLETLYVLESFGLAKYFDMEQSIDKTVCRFSKKIGIPFKKIKSKFADCVLITDSMMDGAGATLAQIPFVLVKTRENKFDLVL